jgi:hypothetical protein
MLPGTASHRPGTVSERPSLIAPGAAQPWRLRGQGFERFISRLVAVHQAP